MGLSCVLELHPPSSPNHAGAVDDRAPASPRERNARSVPFLRRTSHGRAVHRLSATPGVLRPPQLRHDEPQLGLIRSDIMRSGFL
jgi:hypothetical protein